MTIQASAKSVFGFGMQVATVRGETIEQRIREIADENAMTLSEIVREALRCYVILHDEALGPKR